MRRRVLAACLAAGLLLAAMAPAVLAVDPIPGRPLPDEPPVIHLSDRATTALAVDLDGDGVREMLAVTAADDLPGFAVVQAWWVDEDGAAVASNHVELRRSATFDDRIAMGNGIRIDDQGMTSLRVTEPAQIMTVRRDGRTVALVTAIGANPELTSPCCLTIWEVRASAPGEISLALAAETHRAAYQLVAADLDGDGTDELVITEPPVPSLRPELVIGLLRWDGTRYAVSREVIAVLGAGACCANIAEPGDSDGVTGDDVILVDDVADNGVGLLRLTLRGGEIGVEVAAGIAATSAHVVRLADGPAIVTSRGFDALQLWSWPRDGAIQTVSSRLHRSGAVLDVFGSGEDTRVLLGEPVDPASVMVMPASLSGPSFTFGADQRAGVFGAVSEASGLPLSPFHGRVPGGFGAAPEAYVFSGFRITPSAGAVERVEVEEMALMPGRLLTGVAGSRERWMGTLATPDSATGRNHEVVDLMVPGLPARLELAPTQAILEPEAGDGILEPTLNGVARDPGRPSDFIVGTEPIDVEIHGPPGSQVGWSSGRGPSGDATVMPDGRAHIRLLEAADPTAPDGAQLTPSIWLTTPAGHAYQATWRIRVYRQPPDLGMSDEVPLVDFAPTVAGQTFPGATITVNGREGFVDTDGSFQVPVEVGIIPTEVRIVVLDPVGNRTERVVTRVWPIEYRQLPFAPMAVIVVVSAAVVLWMREPEGRPGVRRTDEDESTFEEIGG